MGAVYGKTQKIKVRKINTKIVTKTTKAFCHFIGPSEKYFLY